MTRSLLQDTVSAMAALAGHPLEEAVAGRVTNAIGPALALFAEVEGTLPFEAEPAHFRRVQTQSRADA